MNVKELINKIKKYPKAKAVVFTGEGKFAQEIKKENVGYDSVVNEVYILWDS